MLLFAVASAQSSGAGNSTAPQTRTITIAEVIESTVIVPLGNTSGDDDVAAFSSNRKRFVIETRRGNLGTNANDYALLLFDADSALSSPPPSVLLVLSSFSNEPAISDVRWLDDDTIAFVGADTAGVQQVYTIDCRTRKLARLTRHSTDVVSYAASVGSGRLFFTAKQPPQSLLTESGKREGIIVSREDALTDLVTVRGDIKVDGQQALFSQALPEGLEVLVQSQGINDLSSYVPGPALSPDGRYLIIKTMSPGGPPPNWAQYQDRLVQAETREGPSGRKAATCVFELVDASSGRTRVLINAPSGFAHSEIAWSADSRSAVISGTYLPLEGSATGERHVRETKRFVVEVEIPDGNITPITDRGLRLQRWDKGSNTLLFRASTGFSGDAPAGERVAYRKTQGTWRQVEVGDADPTDARSPIKVLLEQDINTRPKLFAVSMRTGRKSVLLDPNPQFDRLRFGRVENISFTASNGRAAQAALFFPADYVKGKRYPLVIQTHGNNLHEFAIDGPYSTAFAAQPLSGKDIAVVQLLEDWNRLEAPGEVTDEVAVYEGVIDHLQRRGLIDRDRVGIIAFSRTGLAVERALVYSPRTFAAAILADISDAGYFGYIAYADAPSTRDHEIVNGGAPFGKGLHSWVQNSPGFNLERVHTPVWMSVQSPGNLFEEWEWFVGLSRLGKPGELVYMPEADHVVVKPQDRMISQGSSVDWFDFWLSGREDRDPRKADQYRRWEKLCDMQIASNPGHPTFCVGMKH
jgi:hypothetical protein